MIIISAPSGAGKTTIIKELLKRGLNLEFSVSATSRAKREGEIDGKDYYYLTAENFKKRIDDNEFVEYEEVYSQQYYGTLKSELQRIWDIDKHVLFDVDVKGGVKLKSIFGDKSKSIFIMPPSVDELEKRLRLRGTESEASLTKRVTKAKEELTYAPKFDIIVINDVLETAIEQAFSEISDFLKLK